MVEISLNFIGRELSPLYFPQNIFDQLKNGRIYVYFRPTKFDRKYFRPTKFDRNYFRPSLVEINIFDRLRSKIAAGRN